MPIDRIRDSEELSEFSSYFEKTHRLLQKANTKGAENTILTQDHVSNSILYF